MSKLFYIETNDFDDYLVEVNIDAPDEVETNLSFHNWYVQQIPCESFEDVPF